MTTDNVTPILPPKDDGKPRRSKALELDASKLTFRRRENDDEVSIVLLALRYQFEAIQYTLDKEEDDTKASYLATGGAAIVQGLIERLHEDAP